MLYHFCSKANLAVLPEGGGRASVAAQFLVRNVGDGKNAEIPREGNCSAIGLGKVLRRCRKEGAEKEKMGFSA